MSLLYKLLMYYSRFGTLHAVGYVGRKYTKALNHSILYKGERIMLWSQIKLTSYDFSDLHITDEFDNRLGTGRFLRIFSCVVTYRMGGDPRLYMETYGKHQWNNFHQRTLLMSGLRIYSLFCPSAVNDEPSGNLLGDNLRHMNQ